MAKYLARIKCPLNTGSPHVHMCRGLYMSDACTLGLLGDSVHPIFQQELAQELGPYSTHTLCPLHALYCHCAQPG